jgi:hypothetical protein
MLSSGMLRRVALLRTDVSEEPGASFITVTTIGELGTTQAATSNRRTLHNPEDSIPHSHRRENLKSYTAVTFADDTAIIATDSDPGNASQKLRTNLDAIKMVREMENKSYSNGFKAVHVKFTTRTRSCPSDH